MVDAGRARGVAAWSAAALLAVGAAALAANADRGVLAAHGDKLGAVLDFPDDVDAFTLELATGGQLRCDAKAGKGTDLLPVLRVYDPRGVEQSLDGLIKREGTSKPLLKKLPIPDGGTGVWTVTVESGGGTGDYVAGFKVKTPSKWKVKKLPLAAAETATVEFAGRADALATIVVKNKGDAPLADVRVLDPEGAVAYDLGDFAPKGKGLALKKRALVGGFGTYRVEAVAGDGAALVDVSIKVKAAKIAKRKITLAAEARPESVSPGAVRQEDVGAALTLAGTGFVPGSRIEVSGEGVSVRDATVGGPGDVAFTVDADADAPFGPRDVTIVPPPLHGEPVTLAAAFVVEAPAPVVVSALPAAVVQEGGATLIDVSGGGFREGGTLSVSGDGLTVGATQLVAPTVARVLVTAAADAPLGPRDVTWTQPAEGGSAPATATGALAVHAPQPAVTSVSPAFLRQGDAQQTLTVTGTGFRDGGELSLAGSGLTVGETVVQSTTTATVVVSVDGGADLGDRRVTFTQPSIGGGAEGSASGVFGVRPPLPTLTSLSPVTLRQGDSARTVTLRGTGFRAGGTVTVSGDGVSASGITLVSSVEIEVDLTAASDAPFGLRDVTYAQPAVGGAESVSLVDALTVEAPVPTVVSTSPAFVRQGDVAVVVTVTGAGFRDGGVLSISGAGLSVGATSVVSDTTATVAVTVDGDAAVGERDVTFTQAAGIGGAAGSGADVLAVRYPSPTVASVAPDTLTQGDSGVVATLTGTGFRAGGTVSLSGSGLTLSSPTFISATTFRVTLAAAGDATLGPRDVTFTQPAAGGGDAGTLADGLQVDAPAPTVTSASPTELHQGDSATLLTVTGDDFRDGGTVGISGAGLTLGATTVVGPTEATVEVTIDDDATVGDRDVTFTQPAAGGGASAAASDAVSIAHPVPTLTAVSPTTLRQTDSGTFTLTGTGFRSGGTVTTDATGVTLSNPTFVSGTSFTVAFSAAADAALGKADLTYTQPSNPGGGASVTLTDAFEVFSQAPTLTSLEPDRLLPGTARVPIVVTGTNFDSGTSVSVSGSGVTIHSTTFDSSTQLTLDVSAGSSASIGTRDLTITPGSGPSATFDDALRLIPADPTVTAFSHTTLSQGASGASVTITGTGFRSGATVSASGSGITFSSVTVSSTTAITATVAVQSGATAGLRSITVQHGTSDGGGSGTLADATRVIGASPTVTSANPTNIAVTGSGGPTRTVPVVLTGTNFMSGATVGLTRSGGSGVSVVSGSVEVLSSTSIACELSITGTASTGLWDVRVTNPGSLGNSGSTGNQAIDVKSASTLTVNRVFSFDPQVHGGERVTIHGGGFSSGDVVDFGSQRGHLCQVIDQNTLLVTVPQPASTSTTQATTVNVKVTPTTGSAATLTGAYTYPRDDVRIVTQSVFPAQGATGVPQSLRSACVLMTAPMDASSVTYGSTQGSHVRWFEGGASLVSGGQRALGPRNRWLVFTRSTTGSLPIASQGLYVLEIPTAIDSISGAAFEVTRITATTYDQQTFTITTSTDTTAPTVTRTPANNATGVSTVSSVKLVFNEEIDPQHVTSSNLTLKQGATTISTVLELEDDLRTVWLHPETELSHSTSYTVTVGSGVRDLHGNAFSAASTSFTTGSSSDTTNPTIDSVVIESLPSGMDGSTTYVAGNDSNTSGQALTPGSSTAFDLLLPRSGFELLVTFSDEGGAGIDPSTFSAKCSVAVGSRSANAELASLFDVTSTRATWRVGSSDQIATGDNVTFTLTVQDQASNSATNTVITIDVLARTTSTAGSGTGNLDPFDARDSWVLRTDIDGYTVSITSTNSPSAAAGATTTQQSDNVPDFEQALRLVGLTTSNPTSAAKTVTNGNDTGTNAIMRRFVSERIREVVRERFQIEEDGTRDDGSVDIEFLLAGEQGSLTGLPTYGTTPTGTATTSHNEMSIGATDGAENNAYAASSTLGRATYDARNARKEHNINTGSVSSPTGVHLLGMFKLQVNNSGSSDPFRSTVSTKLVTVHGGTPVGEHASDDDVLAGSFDRTTSTNATHNARYDDIMDAVETVALYCSSILAHEIGHSLGLCPDGAPKTGLFGWAHRNNTFTEATTSSPNTSSHMDFGAPRNIMAPGVSLRTAVQTGTDFQRFNPLLLAHLRRRVIYDEGR